MFVLTRKDAGIRGWFAAVPIVFLTAWGLGSCTDPPCNQPKLEEAVFNTPWSTDTEPHRTSCYEDHADATLVFKISYGKDLDATERVKRLEQAIQTTGMSITTTLNPYGGFIAGGEGTDLRISAAASKNLHWQITLHLNPELKSSETVYEVSPELHALLDAVAEAE